MLPNKTLLLKIFVPFALVLLVAVFGYFIGKNNNNPQVKSQESNVEKLAKPLAESQINKVFEFPIEGDKTQKLKLKLNLISAKKVKAVANLGKPIIANKGEEYVVFSIEYNNETTSALKVNSADFFRLIGDDGKKYAPDFYNDSVNVAAISVKKDEVGFIVKEGTNKIKIQVGQIKDEKKEEIEINF